MQNLRVAIANSYCTRNDNNTCVTEYYNNYIVYNISSKYNSLQWKRDGKRHAESKKNVF
jgi:hypothetical protein